MTTFILVFVYSLFCYVDNFKRRPLQSSLLRSVIVYIGCTYLLINVHFYITFVRPARSLSLARPTSGGLLVPSGILRLFAHCLLS